MPVEAPRLTHHNPINFSFILKNEHHLMIIQVPDSKAITTPPQEFEGPAHCPYV